MKNTTVKTTMIKEVIIVTICLILGIAGAAFAGGEESKKAKASLSLEELALYEKIDKDYKQHLAEVLEEVEHPTLEFNRIEIYNMDGNILKSIDLTQEKHFNAQMIPSNAYHLVTDNLVSIYVVLQ